VVAGRGGVPDLARDGNAGGLLVAGRAQVAGGSGGPLPRHRQRQAVRGASVRVDSRLKTGLHVAYKNFSARVDPILKKFRLQKSLCPRRLPSETRFVGWKKRLPA
jgi:hypothetical protein